MVNSGLVACGPSVPLRKSVKSQHCVCLCGEPGTHFGKSDGVWCLVWELSVCLPLSSGWEYQEPGSHAGHPSPQTGWVTLPGQQQEGKWACEGTGGKNQGAQAFPGGKGSVSLQPQAGDYQGERVKGDTERDSVISCHGLPVTVEYCPLGLTGSSSPQALPGGV